MITNCDGCKEELRTAIEEQDKNGLHLATAEGVDTSYPNSRRHFFLVMVDDDGKVVIGE